MSETEVKNRTMEPRKTEYPAYLTELQIAKLELDQAQKHALKLKRQIEFLEKDADEKTKLLSIDADFLWLGIK